MGKLLERKPRSMINVAPTLNPHKFGEEDMFFVLAQSSASNKLAHRLVARITDPSSQLDHLGNATFIEKDFKLFVKEYTQLSNGISTSAAKLLDSLMITATSAGLQNTLVELPLRTYMQMRGLRDEKETRKQVKRDIDALSRIRFEYRGKGKEKGSWLNVYVSGGTSGIKNGIIYFRFNEDFYHSLRVHPTRFLFMHMPMEALRLNDNANPYSYALSRRITEHKRMNLGRPNADRIRVGTLIDACPNFPTYDEVMAGNRNVTDRMIGPFERDMDALSPFFSWHYDGEGEGPGSYFEFREAMVVVKWVKAPDTGRLAANRNRGLKR